MFSCRLAKDFCTSLTTLFIFKMRMRAKYKLRHFSKCYCYCYCYYLCYYYCYCYYPESAITSKANSMQVPFSFVREWGPTTKILFPMAVFLPRLMMLKVSMHENAWEKRAASILENMILLKQLICTLMPLYHIIVPSWFGDSERLWTTNAMHIRLNFRFVPKLWGGGRRGRSTHY